MTLSDQSLMPFGVHKDKPMEKVPASYLLWLWDDGLYDEDTDVPTLNPQRSAVREYIVRNFHALETECKDRIIQHRPK